MLMESEMGERVKANKSSVMADIKPYIEKHLFGRPTISEDKMGIVSGILLHKYSNLEIMQTLEPGSDGKSIYKITIKGFLAGDEIILDILDRKGKPVKRPMKKKDSAKWVDDIEEFLAATED